MKPTRINRFATSASSTSQPSQGGFCRLAGIPSLALFLAGAPSAQAADFFWDPGLTGANTGSGSGVWNAANTNWFDGTANVSWASANRPVFGGADGPFVVTVADNFSTTGLLFNKTGYTLSAASPQTITTTGSTVTAASVSVTIGSNVSVTRAANDSITTPSGAGGILNIGGADQLSTDAQFINTQTGSTGARTLSITNGTLVNVNSGGYFGQAPGTVHDTAVNPNGTSIVIGSATGGTLVVKAGGTVTNGNNQALIIGGASASGTLTIDGGQVNAGTVTIGTNGNLPLASIYAGLRLGAGSANLSGTRTASLNGGTLTVGQVYTGTAGVSPTFTNTFNFNGGILQASIANTTFMTGLTAANVQVGGAKINSNGFDITVGQALIHDPALVATLDGGLTKSGSGTLTLTAANTYDGGTTISEGKLLLSGSGSLIAAGPVSLATGTTLEKANTSAQVLSGPVTGGGALKLNAGGVFNLQNSANSFGALEINNSGARAFINNSASALPAAATVDVSAGLLVFGVASSNSNSITVSSAAGIAARAATTLSNVTLPTSGSVVFNNDDATTTNLTISSNVALTGALTIQVGGTRMLTTGGAIGGVNLSGNLTGSGPLIVTSSGNVANPNFATGVLTLSGTNTYSGDTTVNSGKLAVNGSSLPNGTKLTIDGGKVDLTNAETVGTLFFGAVQQASGTWGSSASSAVAPFIDDTRFTGTGTLIVGTVSGYATWQSANTTIQTAGLDHDNDGVSNGVEHFLGGNTNTTGFTPLPSVTTAAGISSVTWTKAATYTGVYLTDFMVETSATLATGSWVTETLGVNVVITGNEVKYTFPAGTRNFARLKVTGP